MREKISFSYNLYTTEEVVVEGIDFLEELIRYNKGIIRETTLDIQRNEGNPERQNELKQSLPISMASGVFSKKGKGFIQFYSKFIIIDIDYKIPQDQTRRDRDWKKLERIPYVRLMYRSPRGGIKVLVVHDNEDIYQHEQLYEQIGNSLGVVGVDMKCNDLARGNFISYDPDLYSNPQPTVFQYKPVSKPVRFTPKPNQKVHSITRKTFLDKRIFKAPKQQSPKTAIAAVQKLSKEHFPVCKGYRNSHVFKFAVKLYERNVPQDEAEMYLVLKYAESDFTGEEIEQIVNSAYK